TLDLVLPLVILRSRYGALVSRSRFAAIRTATVALLIVAPRKRRRGGKRSDQKQTCEDLRVSHWASPGRSKTNFRANGRGADSRKNRPIRHIRFHWTGRAALIELPRAARMTSTAQARIRSGVEVQRLGVTSTGGHASRSPGPAAVRLTRTPLLARQ